MPTMPTQSHTTKTPPSIQPPTSTSIPTRQNHHHRMRSKVGFQMIELLAVWIVVGLLITVVTFGVLKQQMTVKRKAAKAKVCHLESLARKYFIKQAEHPAAKHGFHPLLASGVVQHKQKLRDPWRNIIVYRFPGKRRPSHPDIFSLGPDGREGGTGNDKDIYCYDEP